jgi:penicillin-binding protein 1A
VMAVLPFQVTARIGDRQLVLTADDWAWTGFKTAEQFLRVGDIIYVQLSGEDGDLLRGRLEEDTGVEGSLLAMDNATGDVEAVVGGRDFSLSQFNRATQSERQTGSSFKPYVYTAAFEEGARPMDTILDAPVSFGSYTPRNFEGNYLGNITLLKAFADSRNIPALKLANRVGIRKVIATAHSFGITSNIPPFLPVALGSVEVTLREQVGGYSVFPNDGVRVAPRLIRRVTNADGVPLSEDAPQVQEATRGRVAREMMVLLQGVVEEGGTGAVADELQHPLGGKTGTTTGYTDAWFLGFSPSVTCGVWVGYDNRQTLGDKETGAKVALPIWMDFMRAAIAGKPDEHFPGESVGAGTRLAESGNPAARRPGARAGAARRGAL